MGDLQRQDTQDCDWSQDALVDISPEAIDALSHILGRRIAEAIDAHKSGPQPPLPLTAGQHGHSENPRQAPYEWSARYLLNKMRGETS